MKLADVILLYSDKEVETYGRLGFSENLLFATNNTIDISEIEARKNALSGREIAAFKAQEKLCDTKNLLYCGRLKKQAELGVAIEALRILRQDDPSYRLIIIGDGPERERLAGNAERLRVQDGIVWCGPVPQKEEAVWFMSAFAFVYPGSIGLSLMHAFAYSLPVITHHDAEWHSPEFAALRHGHNGLVFRRGDARDLARQIRGLADDPSLCSRLGSHAYKTVRDEYSLDRMVDRFVEACMAASEIAKRKRGARGTDRNARGGVMGGC